MIVYRVKDWVVESTEDNFTIYNLTHEGWDNEYNKLTHRWKFPKKRIPKSIINYINSVQPTQTGLVSRTFGVEIECYHTTNPNIREEIAQRLQERGIRAESQNYNHTVQSIWKVVSDSSICGGYSAEVVSPILTGEEGRAELKEVMKTLTELGCRVNRSTGMHVHIGADDLSRDQLEEVFATYRKNEELFDSLVAPSRRGNQNRYCESLRGKEPLPSTRYTKVNYQSYLRYGTIEFRHHQGTLNGDKAVHWIDLVEAVVTKTKETNRVETYDTLEEMLTSLEVGGINWYLERAEELAA